MRIHQLLFLQLILFLIGNSYRKSYHIDDTIHLFNPPAPQLIEGVGFTSGLFLLEPAPGVRNVLLCFSQNQQLQFSQGFTIHHSCNTLLAISSNDNYENADVIPNPASGAFTIHMQSKSENAAIEIYNLQGEIIYSSTISGDKHTINENFLSGIYFVRVSIDANQFVKKLIVE